MLFVRFSWRRKGEKDGQLIGRTDVALRIIHSLLRCYDDAGEQYKKV